MWRRYTDWEQGDKQRKMGINGTKNAKKSAKKVDNKVVKLFCGDLNEEYYSTAMRRVRETEEQKNETSEGI